MKHMKLKSHHVFLIVLVFAALLVGIYMYMMRLGGIKEYFVEKSKYKTGSDINNKYISKTDRCFISKVCGLSCSSDQVCQNWANGTAAGGSGERLGSEKFNVGDKTKGWVCGKAWSLWGGSSKVCRRPNQSYGGFKGACCCSPSTCDTDDSINSKCKDCHSNGTYRAINRSDTHPLPCPEGSTDEYCGFYYNK